jgi:hypothetical protein
MTTNFKLHGKDLSLIFGTTTDISYQITPPSNYTNTENTILNTAMKAESTIDYPQAIGGETTSNISLSGDISIDPSLNPRTFIPDRVFCDAYKINNSSFLADGVCPRYEEGTYPYTDTDGFDASFSFSLDNTSDASHNNIKEVVVMVWGYGGDVGEPKLQHNLSTHFASGGAGASGIFLTFKISSALLLADSDHNSYIIQIKKPTGSFTHYVFIKKYDTDDDDTYITKIEIPKGGDGQDAPSNTSGGANGTRSTPICSGLGYVYNYVNNTMETYASSLVRVDTPGEEANDRYHGNIPFQPKLVPYTSTPVSRYKTFYRGDWLNMGTSYGPSTNTSYGQGGYPNKLYWNWGNYHRYNETFEAASSYFRIYFNSHGTSSTM